MSNKIARNDNAVTRYIIKRNNRRYNTKTFESYEQARSYVRKKLRKTESSLNNPITDPDIGFVIHNNPSHSRYGFSIEKVVTDKGGW